MNKHNERAELIALLKEAHDLSLDEEHFAARQRIMRAAAMLEAQPAREWVGLSVSEIQTAWYPYRGAAPFSFAHNVESKLREKNAGQPAADDKAGGEPVAERVRSAAYDQIDRVLRNNLGDDDYAEYSAALDTIYTHPKPQAEVRVPEHRSSLCIHPVCGTTCCDCNSAISARDQTKYAMRYAYLRSRDLNAIHDGGVFAGMTPSNVVLNGDDLDAEIDRAMLSAAPKQK